MQTKTARRQEERNIFISCLATSNYDNNKKKKNTLLQGNVFSPEMSNVGHMVVVCFWAIGEKLKKNKTEYDINLLPIGLSPLPAGAARPSIAFLLFFHA